MVSMSTFGLTLVFDVAAGLAAGYSLLRVAIVLRRGNTTVTRVTQNNTVIPPLN